MQWKYTTEQGDTWDALALDFYGSEKLMNILTAANPQYLAIAVFSAGVVLVVPPTPISTANQVKAPWDD